MVEHKFRFLKGLLVSFLYLIPGIMTAQNPVPEVFDVLGLGGAGGMYTPASSALDPDLMFVSCDMSGSYRSANGGESWRMINSMEISSSKDCRPLFVGDTIYWVMGSQLRFSLDKGVTWAPVVTGQAAWGNNAVTRLAYFPGKPLTLLVGAANTVYVSSNGGQTWQTGIKGTGEIQGLTVAGTNSFAAIGTQLWKSLDSGTTWNVLDVQEANGKAFVGLEAGANADSQILYAIVGNEGLLRSNDQGQTWTKVLSKGDVTAKGTIVASDFEDIVMPSNQVGVAYVNNSHQIFKTENGGDSWESVFRMNSYSNPGQSTLPYNVELSWVQTDLKWGYYISKFGLGCNPANPDIAMVSTQGDLYKTEDGGQSWKQIMNEKVGVVPGEPGTRYRSIGLEVTSSWQFLFDPFDTTRYYIAYTDVGFARTVDQGKTWIPATSGSGNWSNTFYHVVFDPEIDGRMYAAASNRHDIPHWTHISSNSSTHEGGVLLSKNHGASWERSSTGLPAVPCTWVTLDLKSPKDQRTLYAAMYEKGVYKSVDNGKTWSNKSNGLGNVGNMHVLQVEVHPQSGAVFAGITAHRYDNLFPVAGGLWKSTDGGENWTNLTASLNLKWVTYFTLHPDNPDIIYLSAATAPGAAQGGLYKTTDGGKTWKRILNDADFAKRCSPSYVQAMGVQLHPKYPDIVYIGSLHGLWISADAGEKWDWFDELPFRGAQNITFDPKNSKIMYVNTFGGGVWKGYYLPPGYEEPITGIDKKIKNEFKCQIFPNPNTGTFSLKIEGLNEVAKMKIFNNLGVKIFEKEVDPTNGTFIETIELGTVSMGIYHVKITSNQQSVFKSIVIR